MWPVEVIDPGMCSLKSLSASMLASVPNKSTIAVLSSANFSSEILETFYVFKNIVLQRVKTKTFFFMDEQKFKNLKIRNSINLNN